MERSRVVLLSILILVSIAGTVSRAEIPQIISYQGKVTDASGNPIADGNYTMRFRIYNVSSGGTALWDSGSRTIAVAGGVFTVLLGESPQPAITLDFSVDYWLLVTIGTDDQSPRVRLASAGYAYMASGLVPGTEVSGSVSTYMFRATNSNTTADASALRATSTAATGYTHGLYADVQSPDGSAVLARGTASTGNAYGVYAQTLSTAGTAIRAEATATTGTTYGVYGSTASTSGRAVYGFASATTGVNYGVYGLTNSTSGEGVYGYASTTTGTTYGVHGRNASTAGIGVYGESTATTSISRTSYGIYGRSDAPNGVGVYGRVTGTAGPYAIWGENSSTSGYAVFAYASSTTGSPTALAANCSSTSGRAGQFEGRLLVEESISSTANPDNHVVWVRNSSSGTSPDVLCLSVDTSNPGSSVNYITFLKGGDVAVGAIEGDGAGGITLLSGGSDFAEYLPRLHSEALEAGDVVGVFDGKVSKRTEGASQVMVVSTRPIVLGNSPGEDKEEGYARVAFIGQVVNSGFILDRNAGQDLTVLGWQSPPCGEPRGEGMRPAWRCCLRR